MLPSILPGLAFLMEAKPFLLDFGRESSRPETVTVASESNRRVSLHHYWEVDFFDLSQGLAG
jgi:hypothetical protein